MNHRSSTKMTECELEGDKFQLRVRIALPTVNADTVMSSLSLKRFK